MRAAVLKIKSFTGSEFLIWQQMRENSSVLPEVKFLFESCCLENSEFYRKWISDLTETTFKIHRFTGSELKTFKTWISNLSISCFNFSRSDDHQVNLKVCKIIFSTAKISIFEFFHTRFCNMSRKWKLTCMQTINYWNPTIYIQLKQMSQVYIYNLPSIYKK